jgi:isoleucyl-tRNA synthetase
MNGGSTLDYGSTLNLPKTGFPMKADLPKNEPKIIEFWQHEKIYDKLQKTRAGHEKFILHDGPPYSNGPIHMGQALNKILKDITVKYKSIKGFDAPYVPGWDTHGLPNEIQAIKKYKINRREIDPVDLREKCAESALHFLKVQADQFIRLGIQGEFDHPYVTLDHSYEATIVKIFGQMARKGHVYRGLKPIYWCTVCETALAEAEIEYKDKRSPSIFVKFPMKEDLKKFFPSWEGPLFVLIWTTTPWTLPGNTAVALNPDATYVLVEVNREGFIMAEALLDSVASATHMGDYKVIGKLKGTDLEGYHACHPFLNRDSLIINQGYVTLDEETGGTGCVHTAPGHGSDDFEAGLQYNLPVLVPVDGRGFLTEDAGPFKGLKYDESNARIIEHLRNEGYLLHEEVKEHSYPHCWRCRGPVIFRATKQWFVAIDVEKLRERALEAINETHWIPPWGQERMYNMVSGRPDWCISRQRIWGTPIPAFYCDSCKEPLFTAEVLDHVEKVFRSEGADAWFKKKAKDLMPEDYECPHCHGREFFKEMDIFDVWFESGVSHEAVCALRENLRWPADLYLEGSDQHRGWFQLSLLPAVATRGKAPFKAVLTHGWVLDEKGHTMHKSLGNVIDPMDMVAKYGADILRLFFASVDYTADIKIYHDAIMQVAEVYKKIRNTCRFMLGNLCDFEPEKDWVSDSELLEADRWILDAKNRLLQKIDQAYDDYQFHVVYHLLNNFCTHELSSIYLDMMKDRLYVSPKKSLLRRSGQRALYEVLRDITIAMYPLLSFTSEEIWQHYFKEREKEESVQLVEWKKKKVDYLSKSEEEKWGLYVALRDSVYGVIEQLRKEGTIKQALEAAVEIYPEEALYDQCLKDAETLKRFFIVSSLSIHGHDKAAAAGAEPIAHPRKISIKVRKASGDKCARCWNYEEGMPKDEKFSDLCERCLKIVREHSGVM